MTGSKSLGDVRFFSYCLGLFRVIMAITTLGGGNSHIFYVHPENGGMIEFCEHIFQMGWFNHQLVPNYVGIILNHEIWIPIQLIKQPVFHGK